MQHKLHYIDRHIMTHSVVPQCSHLSQELALQITPAICLVWMEWEFKRSFAGWILLGAPLCPRQYQTSISAWYCSSRIFVSQLMHQLSSLLMTLSVSGNVFPSLPLPCWRSSTWNRSKEVRFKGSRYRNSFRVWCSFPGNPAFLNICGHKL